MRIAMTGYGAVTPLGAHVEALWSGLLHGRSGICELDGLGDTWASLPVRVAAPVTTDLEAVLSRVRARQLDRSQQLAVLTRIVVDVGEASGVELELSSSAARTHGGFSCPTLTPG